MDGIKRQVQEQFGKTADAYVTSQGHARGSDLELLTQVAELTGSERVLDVATGAGHTAFALAPHVAEVVAVDLTPEMIERTRAGAAERGLANVRCLVQDVETLSFPDESFDVVTCRIAAHHFPQLQQALNEMARVLKPGGRWLVVDNYVPEAPELDAFINTLEQTRDRSHVRAHSLSQWQAAFARAGLTCRVVRTFTTQVKFDWWVAVAQTPAADTAAARQMLLQAPPAALAHFQVVTEPELGFCLHKALLAGEKMR